MLPAGTRNRLELAGATTAPRPPAASARRGSAVRRRGDPPTRGPHPTGMDGRGGRRTDARRERGHPPGV